MAEFREGIGPHAWALTGNEKGLWKKTNKRKTTFFPLVLNILLYFESPVHLRFGVLPHTLASHSILFWPPAWQCIVGLGEIRIQMSIHLSGRPSGLLSESWSDFASGDERQPCGRNLRLWANASLAKSVMGVFSGQLGSLSALGELVLARSALEGGKMGAGFRGRRGGDLRTYDMAYFPFANTR